tara:strand:+ start:1174 stop:1815 length:642 start_codon:yes stop_codon:yes gene_type:complete
LNYSNILFDLDFTIFNELFYIKKVFKSHSDDYMLNFSVSNVDYDFRMKSKDIISDIIQINCFEPKIHKDRIFKKMKNIKVNLQCYPGMLGLLSQLKKRSNIKIGLVTNGVPKIQENKLFCLDIYDFFDKVVFAKQIGYEKPNIQPFLFALEELNANSNDTLFVGDSLKNDIFPAQSIGLDTFWVNQLKTFSNMPTFSVSDPNKTASKLKEILV